jgi:hypothetical protein
MTEAPEHRSGFLDGPGSGCLEDALGEVLKALDGVGNRFKACALQPPVTRADEGLVALLEQRLVLLPVRDVDRVVEMLGDVESIEGDLVVGRVEPVARGVDVRPVHVHRHGLDAFELRLAELAVEAVETLSSAIVGDVEDSEFAVQRRHDRHVLMALLERGFVDADPSRDFEFASCQTTLHGALEDCVDFVPAHVEHLGHGFDRRDAQPVDHQRFEQRGEARVRLGPRHGDLLDPVGRTLDSRNVGFEDRAQLARVEVPPATSTRVVARCRLPTGRAKQARRRVDRDAHDDFPGLHVELDLAHDPRTLDAQNTRVQLFVVHAGRAYTHPTEAPPSRPSPIVQGVRAEPGLLSLIPYPHRFPKSLRATRRDRSTRPSGAPTQGAEESWVRSEERNVGRRIATFRQVELYAGTGPRRAPSSVTITTPNTFAKREFRAARNDWVIASQTESISRIRRVREHPR